MLASTGRVAGIVPLVDCVEHAHGGDTFWFGADVDPILPAQLLPAQWGLASGDPTNGIVETADGAVVDHGPGRDQAEFFTPGMHHFMFSITVPRGHELQWTLLIPADATAGVAPVTVVTDDAPRCRGNAPRWAALALTDRGVPDITAGPGPSRSADGRLVASSVVFGITGVRSACSSGGRPLEPLVLWGFDDSVVMASSGLPDEVPRDGFSPLRPRSVVRVDYFGSGIAPYTRTFVNVRRVADPQRLWVNPTNGVAIHGLAATMVLADVYGRCAFGHRVVVAEDPMWVLANGLPRLVVTDTDPLTQQTQRITCTLEPDCPIQVLPGPGGVRWR